MIKRFFKGACRRFLRLARVKKFQLLSTNTWIGHQPISYQPLLLMGHGKIEFCEKVKIGVSSSPGFWSSECYIEARSAKSKVIVGANTWINNSFSAISEDSVISIGADCLIGHNVFIIDSNFHSLNPDLRHGGGKTTSKEVCVGNNVFIGSCVTILKNTHIGDGSVVAAGAVVSGTFPSRSLIAGNPAKLMRTI